MSKLLFGSVGASNPFIIILFVIILFFVLREVITWYWKLNKIVELLEKIEENTRPKDKERNSETKVRVFRDLHDNPVDAHGNIIAEPKD